MDHEEVELRSIFRRLLQSDTQDIDKLGSDTWFPQNVCSLQFILNYLNQCKHKNDERQFYSGS